MLNRTIFLFFLLFSTLVFSADQKNYPPKTPWHLANIWWETTLKTQNFEQVSVDFEIIGHVDKNSSLYIAPVGLGVLNGAKFYGGIQTNSGGWPSKESRERIKFGKGGIFSRWSKDGKPIGLDYSKGHDKTYFESAGYEGEFVSVRSKFHWGEGKYTYSIRKASTVEEDGKLFTWFGAYLYDYSANEEHYIGSLKFKGKTFTYGKSHAAFVEVYGKHKRSEIPQIAVIFSEPKINNKKLKLSSRKIIYPDNKYKTDNPTRYAYSQAGENKVIIMTIPAGLNDGVTKEKH